MKFEISPKEYEVKLNWYDANLYCDMLDINGFGWRLPDRNELNEIYLIENDFGEYWYWSSTENNGNNAWLQFFFNGYQYGDTKNSSRYIRAIRDL